MSTGIGLRGRGLAVSTREPLRPAPAAAEQTLAERIPDAFRRLGRAEALVIIAEAKFFERLFGVGGHRKLGFATFGDLVRERLGVSPRHADNRRVLARTFANRPNVERAFRDGRITACQIMVLRNVLNESNEEMWLTLCSHLTVRELKERIRAADGPPENDEDELSASISFIAPPAAAVAWDQTMETARRVIGADVPQYLCVEAILAEVVPHLAPEGTLRDADSAGPACDPDLHGSKSRPRTFANEPSPPSFEIISLKARRRVEILLKQINRELEDIEDLIETDDLSEPVDITQRIRALQGVSRPLRVLTARLLDALDGALKLVQDESPISFAMKHLRLSETTARSLLEEARLFENPSLARAYGTGRLGLGQAMRLHRIAPLDRLEAWIERAESVTHRQFQREAGIIETLQDFFLDFAFRFPGPFPEAGLEERLKLALQDRGWSEPGIEREFISARVNDLSASPANGADPAFDPALMRRLEILLDLLILTAFPGEAGVPAGPRTFANAGPVKQIRFRAPEVIVDWWRAALRHIRAERGALPAWACAMLLIREAVQEWERSHCAPRDPFQRTILERDGYLCQVPGCTHRKNLQVHHIRFRSRGGRDSPENAITLCFVHHQILLHETGAIAVSGRAPENLDWSLGRVWTLRGEAYRK